MAIGLGLKHPHLYYTIEKDLSYRRTDVSESVSKLRRPLPAAVNKFFEAVGAYRPAFCKLEGEYETILLSPTHTEQKVTGKQKAEHVTNIIWCFAIPKPGNNRTGAPLAAGYALLFKGKGGTKLIGNEGFKYTFVKKDGKDVWDSE